MAGLWGTFMKIPIPMDDLGGNPISGNLHATTAPIFLGSRQSSPALGKTVSPARLSRAASLAERSSSKTSRAQAVQCDLDNDTWWLLR